MGVAVAWIAAVVVALPAHAQVTQEISFPAAQITGAWAAGGCGTGNERGTSTSGASATMTWNDTTTAASSTVVQIQIEAAWKFFCSGGAYSVQINGTDMGVGSTPTNTNNCSCNATPFETSTQTIGPGAFDWNPSGSNTLSFTHTANGWIGVMDNASNWSVRITVTLLNQPPDPPVNLAQLNGTGQVVAAGGTIGTATVRIRATVSDPDADDCFLEAEFQPTATFFLNAATATGTAAPAGNNAFVDITGLADGGYHWQVRSVDTFDFQSAWTPFGNNSEAVPDVIVNTSAASIPKPFDNDNHGGGDCDISVAGAGVGPILASLFGAALIAFGWARRRR